MLHQGSEGVPCCNWEAAIMAGGGNVKLPQSVEALPFFSYQGF